VVCCFTTNRSESGTPPKRGFRLSFFGPDFIVPSRSHEAERTRLEECSITEKSRWHRQALDPLSRPEACDDLHTSQHDEYQDGMTPGSLAMARRCWLDLSDAGKLTTQRFTFVFQCPTERMAVGLTDFLRYTDYSGYVRIVDGVGIPRNQRWQVVGTTSARIWSLSSLEHLFMRLRAAGARYVAVLVTLDRTKRQGGG